VAALHADLLPPADGLAARQQVHRAVFVADCDARAAGFDVEDRLLIQLARGDAFQHDLIADLERAGGRAKITRIVVKHRCAPVPLRALRA
jgi:hypothetical protein